jgi:hypothetical protein
MSDTSELMQKADELRRQADEEADARIRARLTRMADRYVHLAESQTWSKTHPTSAAAIADVFIKSD